MEILGITKAIEEKKLKELGQKLTDIGTRVFEQFSEHKLTMFEADQFIRIVLPGMFQNYLNKSVMHKHVEDVLKEIADRVAKNG